MRRVAITGGLSCGKSSVCQILKEKGVFVVDADEIAHRLMSTDATLVQEIVHLLGPNVLDNGKLSRQRIAKIVFQNRELLIALEALVHPAVYREIDRLFRQQLKKYPLLSLLVAEVPLLFESGGQKYFDTIVAVVAPVEECRNRYVEKGEKDYENRMARQMPTKEKALLADEVIVNSGTLADLKEATEKLYYKLIKG